ncbi:hypothetical protein FNF27_06515 [Cafeteria roenbergensis]|uniref:EF-hand domain-containing protein n=1 Tax=Cafeteria roenbergensis TaxID=33653 RepID=A0A5A8E039_CAFRO|nr:hypothetical protein FNF27_06515 [Cafeteria roenbergensis]
MAARRVYHHKAYRLASALVALLLCALGFVEPGRTGEPYPSAWVPALELACLVFFAWDCALQYVYLEPRIYVTKKWTIAKAALVPVNFIALVAIYTTAQWSFSWVRLTRPVFLLERFRNVRRIAASIISATPKILSVGAMLGMANILFGVLGFVLLAGIDGDQCTAFAGNPRPPGGCSAFLSADKGGCSDYFASLFDSMTQFFVLTTTANFPEVMLPAYRCSPGYAVLFVSYVLLSTFFLLNLTLAATYIEFKALTQRKVLARYSNIFDGVDLAFERLLLPRGRTYRGVSARVWADFFCLLHPSTPRAAAMELFRSVDGEGSGFVFSMEFRRMVVFFGRLKVKPARKSGRRRGLVSKLGSSSRAVTRALGLRGATESSEGDGHEAGEAEAPATGGAAAAAAGAGSGPRRVSFAAGVAAGPRGEASAPAAGAADPSMMGQGGAIQQRSLLFRLFKPLLSCWKYALAAPPDEDDEDDYDDDDDNDDDDDEEVGVAGGSHAIVLINAGAVLAELAITPSTGASYSQRGGAESLIEVLQYGSLAVFLVEVLLKLWAFGLARYARNAFNRIDMFLALAAVGGTALEVGLMSNTGEAQWASAITFVRTLRILRPLRTIAGFGTTVRAFLDIIPVLGQYVTVLAAVFYGFAVVGVAAFAGKLSPDDPDVQASAYGVRGFYPYNFNSLGSAMTSLFYLMVVNDWPVLMEGCVAAARTNWARAFFVCFYLVTVVLVLNVLVAFIIESFALQKARIQTEDDAATARLQARQRAITGKSKRVSMGEGSLWRRRMLESDTNSIGNAPAAGDELRSPHAALLAADDRLGMDASAVDPRVVRAAMAVAGWQAVPAGSEWRLALARAGCGLSQFRVKPARSPFDIYDSLYRDAIHEEFPLTFSVGWRGPGEGSGAATSREAFSASPRIEARG